MMMDFDHSMTHKETSPPSVLTGYSRQMCDHAACNRCLLEANGSKVHRKPRGFFLMTHHTGGYKCQQINSKCSSRRQMIKHHGCFSVNCLLERTNKWWRTCYSTPKETGASLKCVFFMSSKPEYVFMFVHLNDPSLVCEELRSLLLVL